MAWALEITSSMQPPALFFGFSVHQSLILPVIIDRLKHCFHRQAKILGCFRGRFPFSQHGGEQMPDVHVAIFNPEGFTPRVAARFKVFIAWGGFSFHNVKFTMPRLGLTRGADWDLGRNRISEDLSKSMS